MSPTTTRFLSLALAMLVGACASHAAKDFPKGSPVASVLQRMGTPTGEYASASGGRRLEYSGGRFGKQTYMFDFDAAGQLLSAEQVLTELHFNAIKAGMTSAEVLSQIGKPSTTWAIPRQHQIVWSYRYESLFCQWFMVGMSPEGQVVDTAYGPDPVCDDDDFFGRFMQRR